MKGTAKAVGHELPVNARWVVYVLDQRGIKSARAAKVQSALKKMAPNQVNELRLRVSRLQTGADQADDLDHMAQWVRGLEEEAPDTTALDGVGRNEQLHAMPLRLVRTESSREFEKSLHIYAKSGALTIERVVVNGGNVDEKVAKPFHTIQLEMATAISRMKFEWDKKIIFRLTRRELPLFAACLFGWCRMLACGNHGETRDKFLTVENQPGGLLYVKLKQGKRLIAIPVGAEEMFDLIAEVLLVLGQNAPHVDSATLLQMIQRAGTMHEAGVGRNDL